MIIVHGFGAGLGLPDPSSFVTKVHLLLKMANISFKPTSSGFDKAPKGKVPYINDNGTLVGDSTLIRFYLEEKYKIDFNKDLNDEQRSITWAFEKMLDEQFYFIMVHERWLVPENFEVIKATFFSTLPPIIRTLVPWIVLKKMRKTLRFQGTGLHIRDEMLRLGAHSIKALADFLGNKPYFGGETLCALDASAYAFISGILCRAFNTPLRDEAEKYKNLVNYCERIRVQFFSEYQSI